MYYLQFTTYIKVMTLHILIYRILRSPTSFSRILRGDMGFSRILRDHDRVPEEIEESDDDDTSYPARSLRTSGFSRIL